MTLVPLSYKYDRTAPAAATAMKAFLVQGTFRMGRSDTRFTLEIAAKDDAGARERVFSEIGSRHRAGRREITISGVKEIPASDLKDGAVRRRVELGSKSA